MKLPEIPVISPILELLHDKSVVMFIGSVLGTIAISLVPDVQYHDALMVLAVGGSLILVSVQSAKQFFAGNAEIVGVAVQGLIDALEKQIGEIPDNYEKMLVERVVTLLKGLTGDHLDIKIE